MCVQERSVSELADLYAHFMEYPKAIEACTTQEDRGGLRSQALAMLTDTVPGPALTMAQALDVCCTLEGSEPCHVAPTVDELLRFIINKELLSWRPADAVPCSI